MRCKILYAKSRDDWITKKKVEMISQLDEIVKMTYKFHNFDLTSFKFQNFVPQKIFQHFEWFHTHIHSYSTIQAGTFLQAQKGNQRVYFEP